MTSFLREASSRVVFAIFAGLAVLLSLGAVVAVGAAGRGDRPPSRPLAEAVASSLKGPSVQGVSARVKFTNAMLGAIGTPEGGDPLVGGGSGRLWASDNGDVRIELQSDGGGGDLQLLAKGDRLWLYHPAANTVYRTTMNEGDRKADRAAKEKWPPGVAAVQRLLRRLTGEARVSGAVPDNVAGRPAYSTRIEPKRNGGLVGGADVSWDAANGAPLRIGIFAKGAADPVLSLEATSVDFGPVDPSVFDVSPPADARTQDLTPQSDPVSRGSRARPVSGLAATRAAVGFDLAAPGELAGKGRTEVMAVGRLGRRTAVVRYGKGLGGITVIEAPASPVETSAAAGAGKGARDGFSLPTTKIGSVRGTAVGTPLGSVVSFTRGGVAYTVFGSVTAGDALAAARGL